MIFGAGGAAAAGMLLILLAIFQGLLLLVWWGWRWWSAHRGAPRPALQTWQWVVAVLLSVLPIWTALLWGQDALSSYFRQQYLVQQDRQRYFTVSRATTWGDIVIPVGSHAQRELLEDEKPLKGDASDLQTLTGLRFTKAVPLGDLSINALGLNGQWLLLELAQPHRFAAEDCPAGYIAQFKALKPRTVLRDVPFTVLQAQPLHLADWSFDSCYDSPQAILMQYWEGGELVWMDLPDYGLN